ncbi:ribosomal protein L36e [Atractiella rhizophila]|nr:ribosomal protein L36e [Atractiella rhizophila]
MSVEKTGLPNGMNRGRVVRTRNLPARPANRKGAQSKRNLFVKNIVREVAGFAPYEKRVMELIRNSKDKKAKKLTKARLGTLKRAKRKIDDLTGVIAEQRRTGAH